MKYYLKVLAAVEDFYLLATHTFLQVFAEKSKTDKYFGKLRHKFDASPAFFTAFAPHYKDEAVSSSEEGDYEPPWRFS